MYFHKKYRNQWVDPLGIYERHSPTQCNIDPGTAMVIGSAIAGGSQLGGSLISAAGSDSPSMKKISTFSKRQKQIDKMMYDLLMGVQRDAKGQEIGRDPWLLELMQRKKPLQKAAPFTANQQNVMSAAAGMMPRVTNPRRPDPSMLSQLGQGVTPFSPGWKQQLQPSLHYAAAGGTFKNTDTVIVGEDGPELVTALAGGGFHVTPNPKTTASKANLAAGLSKSKKLEKQTGKKGMVTGGIVDLNRRKSGDFYLPYDMPNYEGGTFWDTKDPWSSSARTASEQYMADTYGKEPWYNQLQNKYGGDIGTVAYTGKQGGRKNRNIHAGYSDALSEWWNQQEAVTGRPEVDDPVGRIGVDQYSDFSNWWQGSAWNDPTNEIVTRGGKVAFKDPYSVDLGNLNQMIPAYLQWYTSPGGPGYAAPPAEPGPDWNTLLGQISPDQYSAFNEHLGQFQGGALAGSGVAWDPTTGEYRFTAPDQYYPGMEAAVASYQANPLTAPVEEPAATAGEIPSEDEMFNTIFDAISTHTANFDPTNAQANFEASVVDPSWQSFEEYTRPSIRAAMAGDAFFGSGREKKETRAANQLTEALAGARGEYMQTAEEAHRTRALAATNSMMTLAKMPSEILSRQATTDHVNALTAGVFHDMEWTNALSDAQLTNQTLSSLALLWTIFSPEQQYDQDLLNAGMINAMTDENGFNWETILALMMGTPYQDQGQTAVVTS